MATILSIVQSQLRLLSGRHSKSCLKVASFPSTRHESTSNVSLIMHLQIANPRVRFILATESYGGHYGPSFVTFFDEQNAKIDDGQIAGEKITVSALMINKYVECTFVELD